VTPTGMDWASSGGAPAVLLRWGGSPRCWGRRGRRAGRSGHGSSSAPSGAGHPLGERQAPALRPEERADVCRGRLAGVWSDGLNSTDAGV
jgi:hypothetical protein